MRRLFLLGDAPLFDLLSELGSRIGYEEIHRGDDPPKVLGPDDHVVVGADGLRARDLLARVLAAGDPGYLGLVASEKDALVALLKLSADRVAKARLDRIVAPCGTAIGAVTPDEQAIAVAAELITARRCGRPN